MDTRLINKPIHYLIIDTSTPIVRIGIWNAIQKKLLCESLGTIPYDATTSFFTKLDECLVNVHLTLQDIDLIIAITGPGSFTSLRAGLSIAKGLSLAKNIPTIGLTSFEAHFTSIAFSISVNSASFVSHVERDYTSCLIPTLNQKRKHYPQNYDIDQYLILLDTMKDDFYAALFNKQGAFIKNPLTMSVSDLETFNDANTFITGNADHPKITKIDINLSKIATYVFEKTDQGIEMNSNIAPFYLKDPVYLKS